MVRTFLDTGILLSAWKGEEPYRSAARQILEDENRFLIASPFLRLELLPKALNRGSKDEVDFLHGIFNLIEEWISVDNSLIDRAIQLGIHFQLRNIDTIHAASAERANCDQFVTSEFPGKPYYSVVSINAIYILDAMNI